MLIRWNRHGVTDPLAMNGMTKKEATLVWALKELNVKVHLRYINPWSRNLYTSTAYHLLWVYPCRHAVYMEICSFQVLHR